MSQNLLHNRSLGVNFPGSWGIIWEKTWDGGLKRREMMGAEVEKEGGIFKKEKGVVV